MRTIRSVVTALLLAGLALLAAACGSSVAAPAPYHDANAKGYIGLCNKAGKQITSGSIYTVPFAWRAVSSQPAPAPYDNSWRTAILLAYQPQQGLLPGEWSGAELTASSRYSNPAHPMAEATGADGSLDEFLQDYPTRWDGFLELRIYLGTADAAPFSLNYPVLNIRVTGGRWHAVGGGRAACNAGKAISIESILLPKTRTATQAVVQRSSVIDQSKEKGTDNMYLTLRRALAASATAMLGVAVAGGTASAHPAPAASAASPRTTAPAPPWEPDPNSVGALRFFNSSGEQITSGSINASPLAAYVEGTNTIRAGDTLATLYGYLPVKGQATGQYSGEQLGESTPYPDASAPAPLNSLKVPLETGHSGDETIAQLMEDYPNTDTSSDGYAGMYQLRLRTSGPGRAPTVTYDSADIHISGDTWTVVYSRQATTTTLTTSPATSAEYDTSVTLTASISTSSATGTVELKDGTTELASVAVSGGKATYTTTTLPAGLQKLTAVFTSSEPNFYGSSTSAVHEITIDPHPTATVLKASATTTTKGQKLTLTATESPAAPGSVTFYNGTAKLATVAVSKGSASYSTTTLTVGTHSLKAVFTAKTPSEYASSTSKTVTVTVKS